MLDSSEVESVAAEDGVFVGLDWGNSHHQLCILDAAGRMLSQSTFAHDVTGAGELAERLGRHGRVHGIAIERSEGLLVETLQEQGHRLFCVSPKMSARARERYRLAPTKSDAFDALMLADTLRHEHRNWRALTTPSPLLAELRALTHDRERLISNQRDVENQLRAIVLTSTRVCCTCSPAWTATSRWRSCVTTPHPHTPGGSITRGWRRSAPATATPGAPHPSCSSTGCGPTC